MNRSDNTPTQCGSVPHPPAATFFVGVRFRPWSVSFRQGRDGILGTSEGQSRPGTLCDITRQTPVQPYASDASRADRHPEPG